MTTTTAGVGMGQHGDVYSLPQTAAANAEEGMHQSASLVVQATPPVRRIFTSPWSTADGSVGWLADTLRPSETWLEHALRTLAEVDEEIAEEGLPAIGLPARKEAERIIVALARHPWAPTVYPTQDAEIAIHFKSPDRPNSVIILLDSHGRGECYAYTGGRSRRAHYDVASDMPDGFVREQLRALAPGRAAGPATQEGLGTSAMVLFVGAPTGL